MQNLGFRQKYSATRRIFNSFSPRCDETLSLVFDVLIIVHQTRETVFHRDIQHREKS